MKDFNEHSDIYELLVLHLSNALHDDRQKEILENWLNEDIRNRALLNELENKQNREQRKLELENIDISKEWNKFAKRISYRKAYFRQSLKSTLRKAAAIMIPLSVLVAGYYVVDSLKKTTNDTFGHEIIPPGTKMAKLVLSSGETIKLSPNTIQSIESENGTLITNTNSLLTYKPLKPHENLKTEISYNSLIMEKGWEYQLILPDGTKVWLNSETKLVYPLSFPGKTRRVELQGEAYFEVTADKNKAFIVSSDELEIEVLGTSFSVSSYPDNADITTVLVEGAVKVRFQNEAGTKEIILQPDQQSVFNKRSHDFTINRVDAKSLVAWTQGKFVFHEESLESIFKKLGRWYPVHVEFENEEAREYLFSGKLQRFDNCNTILELMERTTDVTFEFDKNRIIVK